MKKVLILAYDFPPYVSVGGLRPHSWYKHFHECGIEPIVVTRQWANDYQNHLDYIAPSKNKETIIEKEAYGTIIRTAYKPNWSNRLLLKHGEGKYRILRKALTAYYEFMQYIRITGTKKQLYLAAEEYLSQHHVDAIIATGEPFVLFKYGQLLSKKFSIPWVADFRDPWTQNKNRKKLGALRLFDRYFEKRFVSSATAITTVTDFFKSELEQTQPKQKVHIIPNGFDASISTIYKEVAQNNERLSIAFMGTIYDWHPWRSIIRAANTFIEQTKNAQFELVFYGINIEDQLKKELTKYPALNGYIRIVPRMQNRQLVLAMAESNAFLLFNYYSFIGTKIYDYLALRRQIIYCYTNDDEAMHLKEQNYSMPLDKANLNPQIDVIKATNSGVLVENNLELVSLLSDLHEEFLASGKISCNSENTDQFSRQFSAERLSAVLLDLMK